MENPTDSVQQLDKIIQSRKEELSRIEQGAHLAQLQKNIKDREDELSSLSVDCEAKKQEIYHIGLKIDEANEVIKQYDSEDIESKKQLLKELANGLEELKQEKEIIAENLSTERKEDKTLSTTIKRKTTEKQNLTFEVKELKKQIEILEDQLYTLRDASTQLNETVKEEKHKRAMINGLDEDIESLSHRSTKLSEIVKEKDQEVSSLQSRMGDLNTEIERKLADIKSGNEKVLELQQLFITHNSKLKALVDEYRNKEEELKKSLQNIEDNKRFEWEKREGDISLKESWIGEKAEQIESTKKELEKHFGRKVDIIT